MKELLRKMETYQNEVGRWNIGAVKMTVKVVYNKGNTK